MTKVKKFLYISNIAVPQQIKFSNALSAYFDVEFWFYEYPDRTRGSWWRMELGSHCKVFDKVLFCKSGPFAERYIPLDLSRQLNEMNPDIVMIGGLSVPGNYLAYRWARKNKKKVILFSERSRDPNGVLRKRTFVWKLLRWLYRDIDLVIVSAEDAVAQFRDEFRFGDKVVAGRYSSDLDDYFSHPMREQKPAYTYLFANRMTEIYNPVGAIDIFAKILKQYPESRLVMNAAGELANQCRSHINKLGISSSVEFLTNLKSWGDLSGVYARCDVLLLPASFSNGNFTILEAMASGMGIVISNKILDVGDMIKDGDNGFNCDPSLQEFVNRIERYIADPSLFRRHAILNREAVAHLGAQGTAKFFSDLIQVNLITDK